MQNDYAGGMHLPGFRRETAPLPPPAALDAEPWREQGAVDRLIELQTNIFQLSMSNDPNRHRLLAETYGEMAETEAGIHNHSEEVGYLYEQIENFESGLFSGKVIVAHCVIAQARFNMGLPELGYAAYRDAIGAYKKTAAMVREDLATIDDETMIDLYRPKRETPELPAAGNWIQPRADELIKAFRASVKNADFNAYQAWLARKGSREVADTLRIYTEAQAANRYLAPLIGALGVLLTQYTFPKQLHETVIGDLESFKYAGPYAGHMSAYLSLLNLRDADHHLLAQSGLDRKHRKQVTVRRNWYDATVADFGAEHTMHYGGAKGTVPSLTKSPAALIKIYKQRFAQLHPDSDIEKFVHSKRR